MHPDIVSSRWSSSALSRWIQRNWCVECVVDTDAPFGSLAVSCYLRPRVQLISDTGKPKQRFAIFTKRCFWVTKSLVSENYLCSQNLRKKGAGCILSLACHHSTIWTWSERKYHHYHTGADQSCSYNQNLRVWYWGNALWRSSRSRSCNFPSAITERHLSYLIYLLGWINLTSTVTLFGCYSIPRLPNLFFLPVTGLVSPHALGVPHSISPEECLQ